ncbi:TPA: hypothetical protein QCZ00_003782 [Bacillus cereus]|uniref:hypothetical protein n=1 Tax=Bacillus paranthracis TaxID=2026186 RepID=UPI0022E19BDC|nr:hypothetical protein [Bacillus paranthracis]HDR8058679.1 hypothetical protein [Bacillus cereus]MED0977862.1 hypothetical protein [Bacillus paranthracis]MED1138881.1 hypothetical protein [Bacillus paranthracis]HDR8076364.1 hypothetical protein [Bacillus cereus]HDR8414259.1 hypothetical protein [Bacillus cereus]
MAYIEKTVTEAEFQNELASTMIENGWKNEKTFYKYIVNETKSDKGTTYNYFVAKHIILKNEGGSMYGIAQTWSMKPKDKLEMDLDTDEGKTSFYTYLENNPQFKDRSCMYVYMIEKVPDYKNNDVIKVGATLGREIKSVMDVELADVIETKTITTDDKGKEHVTTSYEYLDFPELMMSPWVKITLRNTRLKNINTSSNWWPDSLVRITGQVDKSVVMLLIQADRTPAFENNVVPVVPLYMGRLEGYAKDDAAADALWAGSAFDEGDEDTSHRFNFEDTKPFRDATEYMPRTKAYPKNPGNGIDNVIIKRSRFGARYQAHYIAWNVPSNMMPPDRKGNNGGQYPTAWQIHDNDEYKYQFNPSIYSRKVHTSRAYIVHPDEGVRGYLPYVVLLSPLGLLNGDKLKVRKETCPDSHDIYRFFTIDAISPITKMPSTAYRPAGLGVFEKIK